jgi:putative transposase
VGTLVADDGEHTPNVDDADWDIAQHRADVLRPVLEASDEEQRSNLIAAAARELGVSRATVYRLLACFRAAEVTSALLPARRGRPQGSRSLDRRREAIIAREITHFYLKPERPRLTHLVDRISARCHQESLPTPDWRTIRARVRSVDADLVARRRHDQAAIAATRAVPGELVTSRPLEIVQIDHTQVDVIVADAISRQGMTRPWLTLAIDVHTRMVVGVYLSLDEPSVVSVGVCLLNAVFEKSEFLASRDLEFAWPTMGLPSTILVDNGSDFRSRAFVRGCQEHGIRLVWRPPGAPHYGGHIERLMGTQMSAVHVLPGSTGSSVADRPMRDSRAGAALTMRELERWLLLEILGKYHQKVHAALRRPPIAVWRELMGSMPLRLPRDRLHFWVSFLPEKTRLLRRDGIHLFGIRYWNPALSQDVGRVHHKLAVRYDPRDLSHVFVRRPNGRFVEARYRHLANPAISLWERDAAVRRLNEKGRREVNEHMIFAAVAEQRAIEDHAQRQSARARRSRERRPVTLTEKPAEVRLRDIDTSALTHGEGEKGSVWDEP